MYDSTQTWRVFYTRSRAEKQIEASLERQEYEVFLPKCEEIRQWKDRKKRVVLPLFPGYIFACVNERERLEVLQLDGVVRNVCMDGQPCSLTEDEIDQLRILQEDPYRISAVPISELPKKGAHVTVTRGAFSGLKGEVRSRRGQTHVVVIVPAIKQAVRVIVPAEWVEEQTSPHYLSIPQDRVGSDGASENRRRHRESLQRRFDQVTNPHFRR